MNKFGCVLAMVVLSMTNLAFAEDISYPDRPIRLIVPTGAGGITDVLARVLSRKLSPLLNQSIIVENKPGASGVVGTNYVAHAKPDGYTLLMTFPSHVVNPGTVKDLPYQTETDFAPISKISSVSEILLVSPSSPSSDLGQLIAAAKAKPDSLGYGTVGIGSLSDLASLELIAQADIKMVHVPYSSEPDVMLALIRGDVQAAFVSPVAALSMIKAGKVKALAISSAAPLPNLPDLPPVAKAGLPGFDVTGWNAIFAPAKTPPEVVAKLNGAIGKALADPELIQQFEAQGVVPLGCSPADLQAAVTTDIKSIGKVLKDAGINPS